ncbi:hypothetical protein [Desulfurococcus amylolyticus]|nr:hypothetical protein [Desulfurococcus amylolyticus]
MAVGKIVTSIIKGLITGLIYYTVFTIIVPGVLGYAINTLNTGLT